MYSYMYGLRSGFIRNSLYQSEHRAPATFQLLSEGFLQHRQDLQLMASAAGQ